MIVVVQHPAEHIADRHQDLRERQKQSLTPALSQKERELTEVSGVCIDLEKPVDYGFGKNRSGRCIPPASPIQSPRPPGGPTFREG